VLVVHVACLWMCVFFDSSFFFLVGFCLYICVCVCVGIQGPLRECRSIWSGASGLPYYCTPLVCIPAVIELLAVWRNNKPKTLGIWRAPACPAHCYEIALGFHYETRPASLCRVIFIPFPVSHLAIAWGCTPVMALALSCLL